MEKTKSEINEEIKAILEEVIEMYDLPQAEITDDLLLIGTLGLSSVDIMHFLASVDMRYEKHLPYDKLMLKDGEYVSDFSFGQIIDFVYDNFDYNSSGPKQMS